MSPTSNIFASGGEDELVTTAVCGKREKVAVKNRRGEWLICASEQGG